MTNFKPTAAEKQRLMMADFQLELAADQSAILITSQYRKLRLSALQTEYLQQLKKGLSVEQLVLAYLNKNVLIRFGELDSLMNQLVHHEVILNSSWRTQYSQVQIQDWRELAQSSASKVTEQDLNQLPFFHGMNNRLLETLAQSAQLYRTEAHVRLCQQGQLTRDMFALIEGSAIVQHKTAEGIKRLATLRAPAVFGEGGFFLKHPRSADVITTSPSRVIRIRHQDEMDEWINQDQAQSLRKRIWILHALSQSFLFSRYPVEIWNDVSTLGHIRETKKNEVIFREGELGASFFTVIQGQLSVHQRGQLINRMSQGSCFGEVALFLTGGRRSATITCLESCLLQEIPQREFYPFLARHLHLAAQLETNAEHHVAADLERLRTQR